MYAAPVPHVESVISGTNTRVGKCDGKLACSGTVGIPGNIPLITGTKVRYENIVCGLSDAFCADGEARGAIGGQIDSCLLFGFQTPITL